MGGLQMTEEYRKSGVDIEAGDDFVDLIKPMAKSTTRPEVISGVGPFAACFSAKFKDYKHPVLVASTDGVGTKLKIAIDIGKYDTIGQDLVAMCVNDLVCAGAEPLFFLDYLALSHLDPKRHAPIVGGIARACKECNCALIGGETAEMPGMYKEGDFDLAGFTVGVVDKDKIIDGAKIKPGDTILGIASSGIHSNGYSLVRKIIDDNKLGWGTKVNGKSLGDIVLTPTKLYPPVLTNALTHQRTNVLGIAHITGGGLEGNVPRILPKGCSAEIKMGSWEIPEIFTFLQEKGRVSDEEMRQVFNLGIGLVVVTDKPSEVMKQIKGDCWIIGTIKKGDQSITFV